ncbi:MAG: hypothetical protein JOZ49_11375, partial [Mycolicibacterium sp.]|nr:hypothetical protein [Mycolicibacterium sp.]
MVEGSRVQPGPITPAANPKSISKKALAASLLGTLGVGAVLGVAIIAYVDKSSTPAHHPVRVAPHAPRRAPGRVVSPGVAPPADGPVAPDPGSAPDSGPAATDPGPAPDSGPAATDPGPAPGGGPVPSGP